jgi:HPt (histidine-containing phosphotransfer) domain-containing protein
MTDDAAIDAQLGALRERFRNRLESYRERLLVIRNEIAFASGADSIRRLKTLAHELAGSAGSLGFAEIGETAAALEQAADRVLDGSDEPAIVIMPMRQLIREVEFSR